MKNVYVMSDIHGFFNKFIRMLKLIKFDKDDSLLILGNVIDYGSQPIELLSFIMKEENIKMCLGRNEKLMLKSLLDKDLEAFATWQKNFNGEVTYKQYLKLDEEKQHQILNFLKEDCVTFFSTEEYILTNVAPLIYNQQTDLTTKKLSSKEVFDYHKKEYGEFKEDNLFYTKAGFLDKKVIFGNSSVQKIRGSNNYKIWHDPIYKDKICINSGIIYPPNRLSCFRLNDEKEFYV